MSFLNKFFKKKDPLLDAGIGASDTSSIPNIDGKLNFEPIGEPSVMADKVMESKFPKPPSFNDEPQSFKKHNEGQGDQELKLISAKLDTLIAKMDSINQRIANLERIASEAQ